MNLSIQIIVVKITYLFSVFFMSLFMIWHCNLELYKMVEQTEKSSELFYIHLSTLSRAYCTQLYLWLSSQRQYKSQKSVQLGSVLNVCRFQQLSKYYQVKRRGINRLSVTSSAELNWIRIKECNRFSTLNNLYCYTNLSFRFWKNA